MLGSKLRTQVRKDGIRLSWTSEEIDFAFDCLMLGMTASETAKTMTKKGMRSDCLEISRNVIVGIWNRNKERKIQCQKAAEIQIGLSRVKKKIIKKKINKDAEIIIKTVEKNHVPSEGVFFIDLNNRMCRFPYGDPLKEELRYCGQPVDLSKGHSYCTMHYKLCYVPPRKH